MLMPRKVAHRKHHRAAPAVSRRADQELHFGEYGIQALEPGWLTARQIEAARIAMTRHIKRGGKVWINVFPDKPVTKKPAETRMGSGKGNPEFWVAVVKPGRTLFELSYPTKRRRREALNKAIQKLPIKARIITVRRRSDGRQKSDWPRCRSGELVDELAQTKQEALNLRFRNATGQLRTPPKSARFASRSPAINTLIRAKEIAAAEAGIEA